MGKSVYKAGHSVTVTFGLKVSGAKRWAEAVQRNTRPVRPLHQASDVINTKHNKQGS